MITKTNKYVLSILLTFSVCAHAETFLIKLTEDDQSWLAQKFSKIDTRYRTEERIDETQNIWTTRKHYRFLDETHGLSIKCSEDYKMNSAAPINRVCNVTFNNELSIDGTLEVHDGFMPVFIVAEIKDFEIAKILYTAINNGMNSKEVFYNTKEMIPFKHSTTGQTFPAFRLRIDCKCDEHFENYSCIASAVK